MNCEVFMVGSFKARRRRILATVPNTLSQFGRTGTVNTNRASLQRLGRNKASSMAHWTLVKSMHWIYAGSHISPPHNCLPVFVR